MKRIIGHIDMDAFFANLEARDNPRFQGKPLVVGADPKDGKGRGVVSTASYPARKYGIHSGMPISRAWKLSEAAKARGEEPVIFVAVDMENCLRTSAKIHEILLRHSELVEQASVDEFYVDISGAKTYKKAEEIMHAIQNEILAQERLTSSVGIGPNKLISKIAAGIQKPNGFTVVAEADAQKFLDPLEATIIPGIGPKTDERLRTEFKVITIKDLRQLDQSVLENAFGKAGGEMYQRARGIDERELEINRIEKSIGEQETFEEDLKNEADVLPHLTRLCAGVVRSLKQSHFTKFKTMTLTVRFQDFETKSRSHTFEKPTDNLKTLQFEALKLIAPFFDARENPKRKKIRLVGVRIEKLQ